MGFSIAPQEVLTVIAAASSLATAIFWGAYLLGKLMGRVERLEQRVEDHDGDIREMKA